MTIDYDKALFYLHRNEWDHLLILMVRTTDDFLSKKIEHFLHSIHFDSSRSSMEEKTNALFQYLDHALESDMDTNNLLI